MELGAADPITARVLERRPDGSALVEVPVITVTDSLDLSRTEGGGKGKVSISEADLQEMAANFSEWPKPVAFGFDGFGGHQDERGGPQPVFVNSLRVAEGALLAVVEVNAFAGALLLDERAFRAVSMEARKNPVTPTRKLKGWVLTGGIFTNNPATDTQFRVAAADGEVESDLHGCGSTVFALTAGSRGESNMADKNAAQLEAENSVALAYKAEAERKLLAAEKVGEDLQRKLSAALNRQNSLETENAELVASSTTLKGRVSALESKVDGLQRDNAKLSAAVSEHADEKLRGEIIAAAEAGVKRTMPASYFEGVDNDPLGWFKAKGFTNITALTDLVGSMPERDEKSGTATSSGKAPKAGADTDDSAVQLSEEDIESLRRRGLDPKYVGVKDENDLRRLAEKTSN